MQGSLTVEGTAIDATPRQAAENFVAAEYRAGRLSGDQWSVVVYPDGKHEENQRFIVKKVQTVAFVVTETVVAEG
jgi:hypothetical protein